MKIRKAFLALSLFLACTCNCFASGFEEENLDIISFLETCEVIDNKIYISPGTVYVAPDQILLNVSGRLLPIENLSADAVGVFVTIEEVVRAAKKNEATWTCRKCKRVNSMEDRSCRRCGKAWNE